MRSRTRSRSSGLNFLLVAAACSKAAMAGSFLHCRLSSHVVTEQRTRMNISRHHHKRLNMSKEGEGLDFMSSVRRYAKLNQKNNQERIDASVYNVLYSPELSNTSDDSNDDDDDDNDNVDDDKTNPVVTLFTRETGAPELVDILQSSRVDIPHTLRMIDITHPQNTYFFDKYKYDTPILHMGNQYWTKGRTLTSKTAALSLHMSATGFFQPGRDEPNAAEMERQMMVGRSNGTTTTSADTTSTAPSINSPRRSRSGDFQKQMMPKPRGGGSCNV